jgi:hypothetical protein
LKNYDPTLFLDTASTSIALNITNLSANNYNSSGVLLEQIASPNMLKNAGTIASATTIAPKSNIVFVSGTTAIQTILAPYFGFSGTIILLPTGAFTTITGGASTNDYQILFNGITAGQWAEEFHATSLGTSVLLQLPLLSDFLFLEKIKSQFSEKLLKFEILFLSPLPFCIFINLIF